MDNLDVSAHVLSTFKQHPSSSLTNRLLLRAHFSDLILSAGFHNFDLVKDRLPDNVNLSLLKGSKTAEVTKWGGLDAHFNLNDGNLNKLSGLGVVKNKDWDWHLQGNINRKLEAGEIRNHLDLRVLSSWRVCDKLSVHKDWKYNVRDNKSDLSLAGEFKVDDNSIWKVRVDSSRSISVGTRHNYGNGISVVANAMFQLNDNWRNWREEAPLSFRFGGMIEMQ